MLVLKLKKILCPSIPSRLFAHLEVTKSEETMKKFETEHHEMKQKNDACDQYVSNLMGEMQRMEAKKANLDSILKRCEDDISSKKTRINKSTLQVEKTENDDLPPIQVDINGLQNQIECLEAETGTELSDTLNKIEKSLLNELKETQTKLGTEFEVQTQALEEISVKHQRLRSLLDDNLLKRKQELEKEIAGSSSRHGQRPGDALSTLLMAQEDLKLCLRELEESNLLVKEVENKFSGAKEISNNLQSELILSKNELDKLIASDAENKKELLKAQETEEKLMNKVCIFSFIILTKFYYDLTVLSLILLLKTIIISVRCAYLNANYILERSRNSDLFLHHLNWMRLRNHQLQLS